MALLIFLLKLESNFLLEGLNYKKKEEKLTVPKMKAVVSSQGPLLSVMTAVCKEDMKHMLHMRKCNGKKKKKSKH